MRKKKINSWRHAQLIEEMEHIDLPNVEVLLQELAGKAPTAKRASDALAMRATGSAKVVKKASTGTKKKPATKASAKGASRAKRASRS